MIGSGKFFEIFFSFLLTYTEYTCYTDEVCRTARFASSDSDTEAGE